MSWIDGLRHRLLTVLRPGRFSAELDDELGHHHELAELQSGDANAARRRFGNRTWYKEETRRLTWLGTLDTVRQDAVSAWRGIAHAPGVTLVVVLTLALGVGANAATFSVFDRLFLRVPAGVERPRELRSWWAEHHRTATGVPFVSGASHYPMYRVVREAAGEAAPLAIYLTDNAMRMGPALDAPRVRVVYASASYFPVLGVRVEAGRLYTEGEDRLGSDARVVVVSRRFLLERLGGDAGAALGRTIPIGRESYTVIGVLGDFAGLGLQQSDVWIPLGSMPAPGWWVRGPWWESRNVNGMTIVQRVASDASLAPIEERATVLIRALNRELAPRNPDTLMTVGLTPMFGLPKKLAWGQDLTIASRLTGVAWIILVIACANVVNLLLARAVTRKREFAVRLALGISHSRLLRLLALESLLIAVMAAGGALLVGALGGSLLRSLLLPSVQWYEAALDPRVIVFTVGIALAAGVVAGIVPALLASRPNLTVALASGRRGGVVSRSRLRQGLVIVQTALSVVLLVGAALFVRSLRNVESLDIGFDSRRLWFGRVEFATGEAPPSETVGALMRQIVHRLEGRPGIEVVARAGMEPMQGFSIATFYSGADSLGSFGNRIPSMSAVSPSFFRAAGIRLLRGRVLGGRDDAGAPAEVVVNEAMAQLLWPGRDAIGQCMRFESRTAPCYSVVGVVENVRRSRVLETESPEQFYLPLGNMPNRNWSGTTIVVRATPSGGELAAREMLTELRAAFPSGGPVITPMTKNLEPEYRPWRLGASLFSAFGLLALLVAVIGIYSTVSYGVAQRTHEFGVRIALGARVTDVVAHVVGQSLRVMLVGVAVGIGLALAAGRWIASLLYDVEPHDVLSLAAVAVLLMAVAVVAALVPAWRASRTDPVSALRAD